MCESRLRLLASDLSTIQPRGMKNSKTSQPLVAMSKRKYCYFILETSCMRSFTRKPLHMSEVFVDINPKGLVTTAFLSRVSLGCPLRRGKSVRQAESSKHILPDSDGAQHEELNTAAAHLHRAHFSRIEILVKPNLHRFQSLRTLTSHST